MGSHARWLGAGGTITDADGPVGGVEVSITGSSFNQAVTTGSNGIYSFAGVPGGVPYSITAEHADYSFAPPDFSLTNLTESGSDYDFIAVNSDDENPLVALVAMPEAYVDDTEHVSFAWSGSDNKTATGAIEYRHRLLGSANESWSAWSLATTRDYDLPNGAYRFEVVARDEAGNVSTFGDTHALALSASPRVTSAELIDNGIWLGAMGLSVPVGDADPSDCVIIQAEQFGLAGEGFVPVRLLSPDGQTVYGTIDYATDELGLPGIIERTDVGFRVTLPAPIAAGETAEYLVQWGYDVQLGWVERSDVPYQLPVSSSENPNNYEYDLGSYLTTTGKHLRLRAGRHAMVPPKSATYNASVELHVYDVNLGTTRIETIEFEAADYYPDGGSGYYGTAWVYETTGTCFVETNTEVWVFWRRTRYTRDATGDGYENGFGLRRFDKETLTPIGSAVYSPLAEGDSYRYPTLAPDGSVWLVGEAGDDLVVYSKLNAAGQIVAHRQTVATHPGGLTYPWFSIWSPVAMAGGKMAFFYQRHWDASATNSRAREQVYIKILNPDGSVFLGETALSPAPVGPEVNSSDSRDFSGDAVIDQAGKVWVSFFSGGASGTHYYYSVLNGDGTFFRNMVETPALRYFRSVDSDGLVWATQDGQLFMLNPDDTVAGGPYSGTPLVPNQAYEPGAAIVGVDSYRLFDRWSTQVVQVELLSGTWVGSMELLDVDKFGQGAHAQDLDVFTVDAGLLAIPGQAPAISHADMAGVLSTGTNALVLSQAGLLGGEMLVCFMHEFSPEEITVHHDGQYLVDGVSAIDFGIRAQGCSPVADIFIVHNDGSDALSLGAIAGPAGFIVTGPADTVVPPGGTTYFTVKLDTGDLGDFGGPADAPVSLSNTDGDENPFRITVSGSVRLGGDANEDYIVDGLDYVVWSTNYQQSGGWGDGDFTGDGYIDGLDYVVWSTNYDPVVPAVASAGMVGDAPEQDVAVTAAAQLPESELVGEAGRGAIRRSFTLPASVAPLGPSVSAGPGGWAGRAAGAPSEPDVAGGREDGRDVPVGPASASPELAVSLPAGSGWAASAVPLNRDRAAAPAGPPDEVEQVLLTDTGAPGRHSSTPDLVGLEDDLVDILGLAQLEAPLQV